MLWRSIENEFFWYSYFIRDRLLEGIRAEPEFSALLHSARHRSEEFQRMLSPPAGSAAAS